MLPTSAARRRKPERNTWMSKSSRRVSSLTFLLCTAALAACGGRRDGAEPLEVAQLAITSAPNALGGNQRLLPGQRLVSINGLYALDCQTDGIIAVRRLSDGVVLYSNQTPGPVTSCEMQTDGNFVVYKAGSSA